MLCGSFLNIHSGECCKIDKQQLSFIHTHYWRRHGQCHVVLSSDVWRSRLYKDSKADSKSRKYHQSTSGYIFNSKKVRYIRNQI